MNPPSPGSTTGTVAIVMAAGLGTRMRSATPKVLHPLCGRPMLAYVLDAWAATADGAASGPPVVVYSPSVEAVVAAFDGQATFALQEEPRGTGDAVRAALAAVPEAAHAWSASKRSRKRTTSTSTSHATSTAKSPRTCRTSKDTSK
ncbi:MAG TPA: NTP transferase domain-containing protein, partial [Candidatus Limnocylindrales bacterium]